MIGTAMRQPFATYFATWESSKNKERSRCNGHADDLQRWHHAWQDYRKAKECAQESQPLQEEPDTHCWLSHGYSRKANLVGWR
jgi:hypothetical protein